MHLIFARAFVLAMTTCLAASCGGETTTPQTTQDAGLDGEGFDGAPYPCGLVCPAGLLCCNSRCIDPELDADDCGGCGRSCTKGEVCQGGACVAGTACVGPDASSTCSEGACCT